MDSEGGKDRGNDEEAVGGEAQTIEELNEDIVDGNAADEIGGVDDDEPVDAKSGIKDGGRDWWVVESGGVVVVFVVVFVDTEVEEGKGNCGFIPAARQCSNSDATVFFLGLDTPRPKCRIFSLLWPPPSSASNKKNKQKKYIRVIIITN